MAASSLAFQRVNTTYATTLLDHAKQLYDFALRCPGDYIQDGKVAADCCYVASGWDDEEAWAATWLYLADGDATYLEHAEALYPDCCGGSNIDPYKVFDWDKKHAGVSAILYNATRKDQYAQVFQRIIDGWAEPDGVIKKTPKGLSWLAKWGSNRIAANQAFMALIGSELGLKPQLYRDYAKSQIYYMLGDCCIDPNTQQSTYSYQMGFGPAYPRAPHHRAASCDLEGNCACSNRPSYHVLYGALVGGPLEDDFYYDKCPDFVKDEVACDYNAGFQGAVAGLKSLSIRGLLNDQ